MDSSGEGCTLEMPTTFNIGELEQWRICAELETVNSGAWRNQCVYCIVHFQSTVIGLTVVSVEEESYRGRSRLERDANMRAKRQWRHHCMVHIGKCICSSTNHSEVFPRPNDTTVSITDTGYLVLPRRCGAASSSQQFH